MTNKEDGVKDYLFATTLVEVDLDKFRLKIEEQKNSGFNLNDVVIWNMAIDSIKQKHGKIYTLDKKPE